MRKSYPPTEFEPAAFGLPVHFSTVLMVNGGMGDEEELRGDPTVGPHPKFWSIGQDRPQSPKGLDGKVAPIVSNRSDGRSTVR